MGVASSLVLLANPGSASRKYALFDGQHQRASLHFEWVADHIVCTLHVGYASHPVATELKDLEHASRHVVDLLRTHKVLDVHERLAAIGVRIVAPGSYFLRDHSITDDFLSRLETAKQQAPIHITAVLQEVHALHKQYPHTRLIGVSDSAFHATKPDCAWNYGIDLHDADRFDIKRFGYHGLSVSSVLQTVAQTHIVPSKVIVCHLGSGASITAICDGKSVDTTMSYSPLDGVIMSTRSGNMDPAAVIALKAAHGFTDSQLDEYLNKQSGLLGLGGSSDIRELLQREADGDHRASLALNTYVWSVRKAIGQMAATLDGADMLIFTGTVGERSVPMRERISTNLHYLGFTLDPTANKACQSPTRPKLISPTHSSKSIFVVPADEATEMVRHILAPPMSATHLGDFIVSFEALEC